MNDALCQSALVATGASAVVLTRIEPVTGETTVVARAGDVDADGATSLVHHSFPLTVAERPAGSLLFQLPGTLSEPRRQTCLAFVRQVELMLENGRLAGTAEAARLAAHQLNNKLGSTLGYGTLLREAPGGPSAARYAEAVIRSAEEAAAIVRRLQEVVWP